MNSSRRPAVFCSPLNPWIRPQVEVAPGWKPRTRPQRPPLDAEGAGTGGASWVVAPWRGVRNNEPPRRSLSPAPVHPGDRMTIQFQCPNCRQPYKVRDDLAETWAAVDAALINGVRGLEGGSSLARLLDRERGVRNRKALPRLTVK